MRGLRRRDMFRACFLIIYLLYYLVKLVFERFEGGCQEIYFSLIFKCSIFAWYLCLRKVGMKEMERV